MIKIKQIEELEQAIENAKSEYKDKLVDVIVPVPASLVTDVYEGQLWSGSPATLANNPDWSTVNTIPCEANDTFVMLGNIVHAFKPHRGRFLDASFNTIANIANADISPLGFGFLLTIPNNPSIAHFAPCFNSGEAETITIYEGDQVIQEEVIAIKPSLYETGIAKSDVFIDKGENLAVAIPDSIWGVDGSISTNIAFTAFEKIAVDSSKTFSIKGFTPSLGGDSKRIGRLFEGLVVTGPIDGAQPKISGNGHIVKVPETTTHVGFFIEDQYVLNTPEEIEIYYGEEIVENQTLKDEVIDKKIKVDAEIATFYNRGKEVVQSFDNTAFIIAGQSQFDGRIEIANLPAWWIADGGIEDVSILSGSAWVDYDSAAFSNSGTMYSMEIHLLHLFSQYQVSKDPTHTTFVIKKTLGGSSIAAENGDGAGRWTPEFEKIQGQTHLLKELRTEYLNASLTTEAETYTIRALLWANGEGDRNAPHEYYRNLKIMIAYIRGFVGNPTLPVLLFGINYQSLQYNHEVEKGKQKLASEDSYIWYVPVTTNELTHLKADKIHFNDIGGQELMQTAWDIMEANGSLFGLLE